MGIKHRCWANDFPVHASCTASHHVAGQEKGMKKARKGMKNGHDELDIMTISSYTGAYLCPITASYPHGITTFLPSITTMP